MQNIILSAIPLFSYDLGNLEVYCQAQIDRCSYYITHNIQVDRCEKTYMEGRMDAFEDVLKIITTPKSQ